MIFTYQGQPYELPDGLQDITLQQVQAWSSMYGRETGQAYMVTQNENDPGNMRLGMSKLWMDYITAALSFFSGIPLQQVRETIDISDIVSLLTQSSIIVAIQGPRTPVPVQALEVPQEITLQGGQDAEGNQLPGGTYYLQPADAELDGSQVTGDTFIASLTLAGYILELLNGDWSNFQILVAGYVRLPGEVLTQQLINPAGQRAQLFQQQLTMDYAAPWAQYFLGQVAAVLRVTDYYTTQKLGADQDPGPDPGNQVPPITNFYVDAVAQPSGERLATAYWDVRPEDDLYVIEAATAADFGDAYVIAQGHINTYSTLLPPPPYSRWFRIKAQRAGMVDSEWNVAGISYTQTAGRPGR